MNFSLSKINILMSQKTYFLLTGVSEKRYLMSVVQFE